MTVLSWLRFTVTLWLLRKAVRAAGWLLLAFLAVALWPVTLVTIAAYVAAGMAGGPAAPRRRRGMKPHPGTSTRRKRTLVRFTWSQPRSRIRTRREWG